MIDQTAGTAQVRIPWPEKKLVGRLARQGHRNEVQQLKLIVREWAKDRGILLDEGTGRQQEDGR